MKQPKLNPSKSTGLKMSKKKHKLRAMTNDEFCDLYISHCIGCPLRPECLTGKLDKPYKTKDGKYILTEVREGE